MQNTKSFQDKSYQKHAELFKDYAQDGDKAAHAKTWLEENTVDAWRHQRMYQVLDPVLAVEPQAKWLTVGDGRYGKDARYIAEKGGDVLATDISEYLLKEAKAIGYITKYQVENAEALTFPDASFDYVFCKESYHHFPRPTLALYEMLRVAKQGVMLIEPNDNYIAETASVTFFRNIKNRIKAFLSRDSGKHSFEESGNYVFCISRREIEKISLGLNYKIVAFKGINDAYFSGVETERMLAQGPLQKKVKGAIHTRDLLCKLGIVDYDMLAAIIFKQLPSQELLQQLNHEGYDIVQLPDNPYITS
jgi:ubiquinone/menaquinone biosynthesis C-methylase UbiE